MITNLTYSEVNFIEFLLQKANSENVEPQDSDSDCDSDLDLPYINNSIILKERTAKTPSSKEITYYIEDHQNIEGDTCLHSSKKVSFMRLSREANIRYEFFYKTNIQTDRGTENFLENSPEYKVFVKKFPQNHSIFLYKLYLT